MKRLGVGGSATSQWLEDRRSPSDPYPDIPEAGREDREETERELDTANALRDVTFLFFLLLHEILEVAYRLGAGSITKARSC
jgi:hypothetical protein